MKSTKLALITLVPLLALTAGCASVKSFFMSQATPANIEVAEGLAGKEIVNLILKKNPKDGPVIVAIADALDTFVAGKTDLTATDVSTFVASLKLNETYSLTVEGAVQGLLIAFHENPSASLVQYTTAFTAAVRAAATPVSTTTASS